MAQLVTFHWGGTTSEAPAKSTKLGWADGFVARLQLDASPLRNTCWMTRVGTWLTSFQAKVHEFHDFGVQIGRRWFKSATRTHRKEFYGPKNWPKTSSKVRRKGQRIKTSRPLGRSWNQGVWLAVLQSSSLLICLKLDRCQGSSFQVCIYIFFVWFWQIFVVVDVR